MQAQTQSTQAVIAEFYATRYNAMVRNQAFKTSQGTSLVEDKIQSSILYILETQKQFESVQQLEQYIRLSVMSKTYTDAKRQQAFPVKNVEFTQTESSDTTALAGVTYINEFQYDIELFEAKRTKALQAVNVIKSKNTPYEALGNLYAQGYKYDQIASELGLTLTNVKAIAKRLIDKGIIQRRNKSK